jgi:hypothetical protein
MIFKPTLFSLAISAAICPAETIANWKVMFTAASGLASSTSGLNTHSPVFGDGTAEDMDGVGVAGRFGTTTTPESVTLAVGQTLTVSASVTLTGGVTTGGSAYRFAVLNDATKFDVPSADNWGGGWLHVVNTGSSTGELFQARTDANYMSNLANAVDLNAGKIFAGGALSANSATSYLWTMTITRDSETTVDLVSSFVGGPNNYSETYTKNDIATGLFTYNAVGMQATTAGDLDRLGSGHPTVKPVELLRYLCRLITPPDGVVLDLFAGSGSTGKAAVREGFRFIGVEREPEYYAIAVERIRHELQQGRLAI